MHVRKRDGRLVPFDESKIEKAVLKAFVAVDKELSDYAKSKNIKLNFIKIDSLEKAKNAPCIFNNWANFYK